MLYSINFRNKYYLTTNGTRAISPSFFDGIGQSSLMVRACAMTLGRVDLSLGIHKAPQKIGVFVVDFVHLVVAKITSFLFYFLGVLVSIVHC